MEQGLDSESVPTSGSFDKSRVLNVKPLRCLVPIFPSSSGAPAFSSSQAAPFVCVPPTGPFPPGVAPFYPFFVPNDSQRPAEQGPQNPFVTNHAGSFGFNNPVQSPVPLNSFRTPTQQAGAANGDRGTSRRSRMAGTNVAEDGNSDSQDQSDQYLSGFSMHVTDAEDTSVAGARKGKSRGRTRSAQQVKSPVYDVDIDTVVNNFLASFNLMAFDMLKQAEDDCGLVGYVLMIFDLLRRRISQIEDAKEATPGATRRPDLRAGAIFMKKGIRTNANKRIGAVPGVEVGDIFFFRMELCLVGLHAPSMAGIDYMSVRITGDEEPIAVSIVSSVGYEDDGDDGDVLIYSGQGGIFRKNEQIIDQKLERGNLALEKSLHRGNEVRVIRGMKDVANPTGKVYVYDGLYKIQESWVEKGKTGCNVFKYKLGRLPGQPAVFTLWKSIQQWKDGLTSRTGVILPDLTSGAEIQAVSLVNDIDDEKGPAYFTYFPNLRYLKPFDLPKPSLSCTCNGGCHAGNPNCPCVQRNGGYLPYTALGVLLGYLSLVHECGSSCSCPPNCRNRVTQAGLKVRLEVFKTKDKGWGLRSWDPIRAGSFICEYAGEVIDISKAEELGSENEDIYIFDTTRTYQPLGGMPGDINGSPKTPFPLVISAKNGGNVARFMNHSCSPNVFWQPVLRESNNECYLHIAFFAIRHIPPMQELTYDNGIVQNDKADQMRKKCLCGSLKCRGYFY
ncbi:histone-lysine N-methyltransferase, H3 lysine-9 specific SUVH1-like [Cornus florida]|uniref:histone-lysine N-methyltransferase, H3 lysine-9 specific SUVH1-like n=1 Tax=Cornus florida TaxID=4283 RepID=UPI0028999588|nr:histone-lysine N-methyltransferase, H3 lysine-9 specific SUVH1-like [Cornus florida]